MRFWDRETLKSRAKGVLARTYWKSLGVYVVQTLITSFGGSIAALPIALMYSGTLFALVAYNAAPSAVNVIFVMLLMLVMMAAVFFVAVLLGGLLEIGSCRFFSACRYGIDDFDNLFYGFREGRSKHFFLAQLKRYGQIFLWTLLFYVPGFIKMYEYFMVPYILAENPNVSTARAFEISRNATMGEKWDMFVLDLSFIGWMLLGVLTCNIGQFFLMPYYYATRAELYGALRYKAVMQGFCSKDEIGAEL